MWWIGAKDSRNPSADHVTYLLSDTRSVRVLRGRSCRLRRGHIRCLHLSCQVANRGSEEKQGVEIQSCSQHFEEVSGLCLQLNSR